jgi:hypothetical protein
MAKPNYQFQKHQRDLQKKKKREEKLQRKAAKNAPAEGENPIPEGGETAGGETASSEK